MTYVSRLLLAFAVTALCAQTSRAQSACDTLGHFVESVSLVRQIQTDPGAANYADRLERLDVVATGLSLPTLLPVDPAATRPTEREALIRYVSGVREATSAARSGHSRYAQQTLESLISQDVFAGLSSLESHWDCRSADAFQAGDETSDRDDGGQTAFRGENGGDAESTNSAPSNLAQTPAASRNRPTTSGEGKGAYFGRNAVVSGNMAALITMLIGLVLVATLVWLHKLARRQTAREARRVIDSPVTTSVNGQMRRFHLVDISMQGFKLRHDGNLSGDGELAVHLGGDLHWGQIRWANANFAGVKFRRALPAETLAAILEAHTTHSEIAA